MTDRHAAVAERLRAVRSRIEATERSTSHPVQVLAVTKGFDEWAITAAVEAGCSAIGENYAQELLAKRDEIERLAPEVYFIGRLQTNKVRLVADLVDVWASVDRSSVVREIAKRRPAARVLIQVDTTADPAKGGCDIGDAPALVEQARDLGLLVEGLMTVGPTDRPPEAARAGFRLVRSLVDDLDLVECSMGMSGDLDIAVEEGSTQVRLGTGLFGPRG